jgi:hypothetical protein
VSEVAGATLAGMLVLRRAQFEAITRQREVLIERTRHALDELFPGDRRLEDEDATRKLIVDGIERAEELGILHAREVLLFVFLVFDLGLGFESASQTSWIGKLLRDPSLAPAEKMDVIYTRLAAAADPERS